MAGDAYEAADAEGALGLCVLTPDGWDEFRTLDYRRIFRRHAVKPGTRGDKPDI